MEKSVNNATKLRSFAKFADNVLEGKLKELSCGDVEFLLRGIENADKGMRNGWRANVGIFNEVIRQIQEETDQIVRSLGHHFREKMEKLDVELERSMNQLIREKK